MDSGLAAGVVLLDDSLAAAVAGLAEASVAGFFAPFVAAGLAAAAFGGAGAGALFTL